MDGQGTSTTASVTRSTVTLTTGTASLTINTPPQVGTPTVVTPTLVTSQIAGASGLGHPSMIAYPLSHLATTFESFSGGNVARYFERVELRARIDNLGELETLRLIKYNLKGEAYEWFKSLPTLDQLSYKDFKEKALQRFQVTVIPGNALVNLGRCYQRIDEDVASFCTRLRTLGLRVLQEDLRSAKPEEEPGLRKKHDDLVLNQFKVGLRREVMKDIGVMLVKEENLDLEKAEQLVKIQELTSMMTQDRRANRRVDNLNKKCTRCGRSGHTAPECYAYGREEQPKGACFICGHPQHWARDCPQKDSRRRTDRRFNDPSRTSRDPQRLSRYPINSPPGLNQRAIQLRSNRDSQGPERFQGQSQQLDTRRWGNPRNNTRPPNFDRRDGRAQQGTNQKPLN